MNLKKVGKFYHARFKAADGSTRQVSTHTSDKDEARKVVRESGLKDLEATAKSGRLTAAAIGQITTGRKLTVAKAIKHFDDWMVSTGKSRKTRYNNTTTVTSWMHDQQVENLPPSSITEKHIAKWINNADSVAGVGTRTVKLSGIRSFFAFMCARGWVTSDPSQSVSVDRSILSHEQKERTVMQPFNAVEVKRILTYFENAGDIFWQFAVRASYELGLRLGDICQLEWACFKQEGVIVVHTDKTNKRVEAKISDDLSALSTQIPVHSSKYLFPEQRAVITDVHKRAKLSVQFQRALQDMGIKGRSFHSLRHSAATEKFAKADKSTLARKLVDNLSMDEIRQLLGHSQAKTTEGYVH